MSCGFRFWLLVAIATIGAEAVAAPLFRITDIGILPGGFGADATDMNDRAMIVGIADMPFLWTPDSGMQPAPPLADGRMFAPDLINAAGDMVGEVYDGHAPNPHVEILRHADGSSETILEGSGVDGADFGWNLQLTDDLQLLGQSAFTQSFTTQPWIWSRRAGVRTDLRIGPDQNSFYAKRMNIHGRLVGYYDFSSRKCIGEQRAFVYDTSDGHFRWLDRGPRHRRASEEHCGHYSAANDINASGQVVGYGNTFATDYGAPYRAFIWTEAGGMQPLSGSGDSRMRNMRAERINDAGQVVGTFQQAGSAKFGFFYWDKEGGAVDLQQLLDPDDPLTPEVVLDAKSAQLEFPLNDNRPLLNNRGQIAVTGKLRSDPRYFGYQQTRRTFLLTPVER